MLIIIVISLIITPRRIVVGGGKRYEKVGNSLSWMLRTYIII